MLRVVYLADRRFDSDFRTLHHLTTQGALGDILEAEIHFDYPDPGWISGWTNKEYKPGQGMTFALGKGRLPGLGGWRARERRRREDSSSRLICPLPRYPYSGSGTVPVWTPVLSNRFLSIQPRCRQRS